jgi:hypothetical protein
MKSAGRVRAVGFLMVLGMTMLLVCPFAARSERKVKLTPDLVAGETILYEIRGRIQRQVKEESRVGTISTPGNVKQEFSETLRVRIKATRVESGRPVVDVQAEFEVPADGAEGNPPAEKHNVDFTIGGNGQLVRAAGLDDLNPLERIAWQFWISQFAFGWTLPSEKLKRGAKWKSEEPENNPTPIGRLMWERETTYGENGKCPIVPTEHCATFFTNASLKQKSSITDSTPEDYRLHELKTSGTATGTNEIYTTISQNTGLVLRGSEDVRQSMQVVIAKVDASNAVKFTVDASSHFEMVMASGAPAVR